MVPSCPPHETANIRLKQQWVMHEGTCPIWRCRTLVVLPRSCMRHLTPKLPELQRSLYHTATPGKTMPRQMNSIQGT